MGAYSAQVMADVFRAKFPGLAVLQLELTLKASVSITDVPFIDFAHALIDAGVRVEITDLRCRAVHYEFLRAALDLAGAVVHVEDERSAYPFSHPKYVWATAACGRDALASP